MGRLLGIDPGQRRVGLAVTDEAGLVSSPRRVVDRQATDLHRVLEELVEDLEVKKIIVGYPVPLRTSENERTAEVDSFISEFVEPLGLPYTKVSERYTTKEARRLQRDRGDQSERTDADAAALILNHYLKDSQAQEESGES